MRLDIIIILTKNMENNKKILNVNYYNFKKGKNNILWS